MDIPTRIGLGGFGGAVIMALLPLAFPEIPKMFLYTGIIIGLVIAVWGLFPLVRPSFWKGTPSSKAQEPRALEYLSSKDVDLGSAIKRMAHSSAWGRWYAAQYLANSGHPIQDNYLFITAGSVVSRP